MAFVKGGHMSRVIEASGSAEAQGELWSVRARDWSMFQERTAMPLYEAALARLGIAAGTRILDVGSGSGMFCQLAAQRGADVDGIDAAPALVDIARQRVPAGHFWVGEMETLPFESNEFDVVTGFNSFQYAANPRRALAEAARVVRQDGLALVAIWGPMDQCEARAYIAAVVSVLPPPPAGAPGPFALADERALRAFAREVGLTPIDVVDVDMPFVYPDMESAVRGVLSAGPAVRAIHAAGEGRVRDLVVSALTPYRLSSGGVRLENRFRYLIASKTT
jgi:SAM-dependent methyltransferase